jgi:subtilisin family serine protease
LVLLTHQLFRWPLPAGRSPTIAAAGSEWQTLYLHPILRKRAYMSRDRWDLLYLDRPASSSDVAISDQGQKSFVVLPFLAIPPGWARPSQLNVTKVWEQYPAAYLNLLLGIDFCLSHEIDALSLSVGPDAKDLFDLRDPLQIATRTAYEHGIPVVVAARNRGAWGPGALSLLAQAPWFIAVGATDPAGRLLESSGRGAPGGPSPTVVSDGTPGQLVGPPDPQWPEWEPGTSFAAPKVAHVVLWMQMCLRLILGNLSDQQAGK